MYILILVFLSGYGPRPYTVMQEFASADKCQAAVNQVRLAYQNYGNGRELIQSVCVRK